MTVNDVASETIVVGGSTPCEAVHRMFDLAAVSTVVIRCTDGSLALITQDDYAALLAVGGGRLARIAIERIADRHVPVVSATLTPAQAVSILCAHTRGRKPSLAIVTSPGRPVRVAGIDDLFKATSKRAVATSPERVPSLG